VGHIVLQLIVSILAFVNHLDAAIEVKVPFLCLAVPGQGVGVVLTLMLQMLKEWLSPFFYRDCWKLL